jgi:C1A family cysteine protease
MTKPVDLRPSCLSVRDQGSLNSCTAVGVTGLVHFLTRKDNQTARIPSPLFTYYATRLLNFDTENDNGASIRDAIKSTIRYGTVKEEDWPYVEERVAENPPAKVWAGAEKQRAVEYLSISSSKQEFVSCLSEGHPFMFGIGLHASFWKTDETGYIKFPDAKETTPISEHGMLAVGYFLERDQGYIIAQNSWGDTWGDQGFCYIPMEYMLRDAYDCWTLRKIQHNGECVPQLGLAEHVINFMIDSTIVTVIFFVALAVSHFGSV